MILDEEVFAVILAVAVVASVFAAVHVLDLRPSEPFTAIGLLDANCKIGEYPREALIGSNVTLCIFVDNHMGRPIYYKVVYRIAAPETLPTNTTPSPEPKLLEWRGVLGNKQNTTFIVHVPVAHPKASANTSRVALVFELWIYDTERNQWIYTGRWVHLYIKPVAVRTG
ncbi:DUF1616 domain-containing protein [Pyrolobus fumarii]|uniref:DUF1616 domain-containing protein n=1 Tax=Pyrolobus fumarii TaxID=54252 RepID=UPI00064F8251|nr:DUF1616 domain-containing protein [Pyrolobus fumarii]